MMPRSFDVAYQRLAGAAERYHAVQRSPDDLDALAEAHWELHLARREIAAERARLEAIGAIYTTDDRSWLDRVGIDA
jgi:hypothetical protein